MRVSGRKVNAPFVIKVRLRTIRYGKSILRTKYVLYIRSLGMVSVIYRYFIFI